MTNEEIANEITRLAEAAGKAITSEETADMFVRFAEMAWSVAGEDKPGTHQALRVLQSAVLLAATAHGLG